MNKFDRNESICRRLCYDPSFIKLPEKKYRNNSTIMLKITPNQNFLNEFTKKNHKS